jgi:mono/diheme cytochrome c family protein
MRVLLAAAALLAASPAFAQDAGQAQFESTCAACHQVNGQGIKGAFPALAGDPFVLGAPQPVITTVLNGRGGMPAWKADLTDAQVAAAISYVRSAWGNKAPPVTEAMVADERAKSAAVAPAPLQSH